MKTKHCNHDLKHTNQKHKDPALAHMRCNVCNKYVEVLADGRWARRPFWAEFIQTPVDHTMMTALRIQRKLRQVRKRKKTPKEVI